MSTPVLSSVQAELRLFGLSTKANGLDYRVYKDDRGVYVDGTGDLQGRTFLEKWNTNLSNTNIDINLTTDLDVYGVAAAMTKLALIYVKYESGTAGSYLTLKQPASNGVPNVFLAAGDGIKLAVGESILLPFKINRTVTPSTGDLLNLVSTVTDAYFSYVILGS